MRNKGGVSRARKRDLNQPDEFITTSSRMLEKIIEHKQSAIIALLALLIMGCGGYLYYFFSERKEAEAFRTLSEIQNNYHQLVQQDKEKAYDTAVPEFTQFLSNFKGTVGGNIALFTFANIHYEHRRFEEAITLYQQAMSRIKKEPYLNDFIISNLAYSYLQKSDYPEAITYYERLTKSTSKAFKEDAWYKLGILYELTGNIPKSQEAFQKIVNEFTDSAYIEIARKKIAG